ncbi:MAG: XdhC/CoxI family protein [Chloroflexota bacterium]
MREITNLGEVLPLALRARSTGTGIVIAVIVADAFGLGAAAGSRMVVDELGQQSGSFHPLVDATVAADALEALTRKRSTLRSYQVELEKVVSAGMQGGNVDIFFEVLYRPPRLVVVGGGHIAVPLARMGKILDFDVTVIDDRDEYASKLRFPDADHIFIGPYRETLAKVPIDSDTYIVLVTRGHVHDSACLEQVLTSTSPYIGMIGSKRRVRTVETTLLRRGHPRDAMSRLFAPIGLPIASETPAEIAVSIMAEIVNVRRGGQATSLRDMSMRHV